jgi:flagellar capping protein FliD
MVSIITFTRASDICLIFVFRMERSTFCKCLQTCVKKTMHSSLFSIMASRFSQVENIKKVYSEKMTKLDRDLSQEAKRYESKEKQMKYVITQLVKQKQELEDKLAKITPFSAQITPLPHQSQNPLLHPNQSIFHLI